MTPASRRSSARLRRPETAARRRPRGSEDFWTPGMSIPPKERVRAHQRAVLELIGPAGPRERAERDAAEVRRAERLRGQGDVGVSVGARGGPALELPPPLVPRTEVVVYLEDDGAVDGVLAPGKRG